MTLPRLCFLSYRAIREFAAPVLADYADRARIEVVDGSFDQALAIAHDRVARGTVDAFVSAGANAALLRRHLSVPVATIPLGGFDILQALIRARQHTRRVGIVMYGQIIPELEAVKGLLNIGIEQHAYTTELRLTYGLQDPVTGEPDPSAFLRLYRDARQVEATHCYVGRRWQDVIGMYPPPAQVISHRMRMNTFLGKWLQYLAEGGHGVATLRATAAETRAA